MENNKRGIQMNLDEAIWDRLLEIRQDRQAVRQRIRRSKTCLEVRAYRKLNSILERTERKLESAL